MAHATAKGVSMSVEKLDPYLFLLALVLKSYYDGGGGKNLDSIWWDPLL